MPNPTEKTLEGGRFEQLFNLADSVDRPTAREVDVEVELQHFNRVLENLVITEETLGDVNMDLLATILAGLVVTAEVQVDDALRQMNDLAADLRRAIAGCHVGSSDETSQASQESPVRKGPRRKRARKDDDEPRELSAEELVRMFVDNTPSVDRHLIREVDPLPPVPEDPSFGDISAEETLTLMMRKNLFSEPVAQSNDEDVLPTRLTDKPDRANPVDETNEMAAPVTVKDSTATETVLVVENVVGFENVTHIVNNPPCEIAATTLDVLPAIEQAREALPQQEGVEEAAAPVPTETNKNNRPKKGKKDRSEPRLELPILAPHLSFQEVDQSQLIEVEMWFLADKLAQSVREVPEASEVVVEPVPEANPVLQPNPEQMLEQELPRQDISTDANTLPIPEQQAAVSPSAPKDSLAQSGPQILPESIEVPAPPVTVDLSTLLSKIEALLDVELIEYATIAKVNLVEFLLQLRPGPKSFYDYFPPHRTSKRQAAAAFQLILGMSEEGLILIYQEDVLKKTPIIISLEERPEFNPVLSLLCEIPAQYGASNE